MYLSIYELQANIFKEVISFPNYIIIDAIHHIFRMEEQENKGRARSAERLLEVTLCRLSFGKSFIFFYLLPGTVRALYFDYS